MAVVVVVCVTKQDIKKWEFRGTRLIQIRRPRALPLSPGPRLLTRCLDSPAPFLSTQRASHRHTYLLEEGLEGRHSPTGTPFKKSPPNFSAIPITFRSSADPLSGGRDQGLQRGGNLRFCPQKGRPKRGEPHFLSETSDPCYVLRQVKRMLGFPGPLGGRSLPRRPRSPPAAGGAPTKGVAADPARSLPAPGAAARTCLRPQSHAPARRGLRPKVTSLQPANGVRLGRRPQCAVAGPAGAGALTPSCSPAPGGRTAVGGAGGQVRSRQTLLCGADGERGRLPSRLSV